ncbi:ABC transporter permease [Clostridium sp.]|jgi:peptide/nickel transport system permease protein|uniref:ABC transporter permease n=1 Tax=Clostridium sp. TaxID=1506 RepID=UPI003EE9CF75
MLNYIIRRILIAIPVFLGITIIAFFLLYLAPGSPIDMMINPHVTQAALDAKREALGLNSPIYVQYFKWLSNMLQGNLGYSMKTSRLVTDMISERIGPTVLLMGLSLLIGFVLAIFIGILSATKQYSILDYTAITGSFLGISIPNFFLGLGLIYIFSVKLKWLPSSGMFDIGSGGGFTDRLQHLILPVTVLAVNIAGRNVRYIRSSMLEILGQDYLRTARAKGLSEFLVINKHALRNALITIVTVFGLEIPLLFAGAVVTETIFSWPGIGQLTMTSILSRDYPTVMGLNILTAVIVLISNLLTDIVYAYVDPRIKYN